MPSDSPLSQISQVQDMVARGKERGFITTEEVIEALAPVDLSAEQIDNVYQVLADENIEVVEMVDELDASGRPAAVPARLRQCRRGPG
ncbi:MAG TPA: RNA polymerase sigma factor region1.1 domain-containing protein [Actinomycetes bacterium]|nr:RNA polymerase sigma factor region1.1 domain-containing protein [Actinomycetes bacterium]